MAPASSEVEMVRIQYYKRPIIYIMAVTDTSHINDHKSWRLHFLNCFLIILIMLVRMSTVFCAGSMMTLYFLHSSSISPTVKKWVLHLSFVFLRF